MLRYEWDEEKELINKRIHKLDFEDAWRVYEHQLKVTVPDERHYEDRLVDFAEMGGKVRVLVYTMRDDVVRCISFRTATRTEREFYYEEIKNR